MAESKSRVEIFKQHRQRLFGIGYRMLGTRDDAEDVVQEAYLRWHKADAENIESPEAWLVTVVTRLAVDRLRGLRKEREAYIGPWLPEPLFGRTIYTPEEQLELASNLSIAFMALLERLSPTERAAFLLRDVFDCSYAEIARIVRKNEAACRQLIHRARNRVRRDKPRFEATEDDRRRLIEKFLAAVNAGDETTLLSLFAEDATMTSDGGGRVVAARKVILGRNKIARLYYHLGLKTKGLLDVRIAPINGELGIVTTVFGQPFAATVFEIEDEKIRAVYQVMNPEKLKSFVGESDA
ncbi:MAG: RNA polymerase sigma factor SigJ [Acidobacteriota bacterium]|nr:RNA polymerase sigma factor SigJ [Acidobacteriota bacterium]